MFEEEQDDKIYNLLITRGKNHEEDYNTFIDKLYKKGDFLWKESVAASYSHLPESFFNKIDAIIILSGTYTSNKEEIDDIVTAAKHFDIPIVLVRPYGMEEVPENLEAVATTLVGWNSNCIVEAIKGAINGDYESACGIE